MARKKNAKSAKAKKTSVKRQTKSTTTSGNALEKSFHEAPTKLVTQFRKELTGLTQQEKKLKSELKRAQTLKKTLKKQQTTLTAKNKSKPNATNKKQLTTIKLTSDKNTKTITTLTTQLNLLKTEIKSLASQQGKYSALNKLITTFEKQWAQKTKAAATPKTRKKLTRKVKTTQNQTTLFGRDDTHDITATTPSTRETESTE